MKKWLALLMLALALGLVAGCGDDDDEDSGGGGGDTAAQTQETEPTPAEPEGGGGGGASEVSIGDNLFDPEETTVKVGDTVTWTNEGQSPHTVTADGGDFDSGNLEPGDTFEQTFDAAGDVPYVCTIHAGQSGTITVEE